MTITWHTGVEGAIGAIVPDDEGYECVIVQTDWDYPTVASTFGWTTELVQPCPICGIVFLTREAVMSRGYPVEFVCPKCQTVRVNPCCHQTTDGTVDCPDCDLKAGHFIEAAGQYLLDNDGQTAEDPGYFET